MKKAIRRVLAAALALIFIIAAMPQYKANAAATPYTAAGSISYNDMEKAAVAAISAQPQAVSGSFDYIEGQDIATIRYYKDDLGSDYGFADFYLDSAQGRYFYSFTAPYSGFKAVQGSSGNVIAEYYNTDVWDGAVDVSWYNEEDSEFHLYTPAQLAGLAAIVNGSIDWNTPAYCVKGYRSSPADSSANRGLPDSIEADFLVDTNLIAGVVGDAYQGIAAHSFADRTVYLEADMDMGGVAGDQIDHSKNVNKNAYDYPNWTPIGGEYLMDVSDAASMIKASFNGLLDGKGHHITNLYCYRWAYRTVGDTAYGYAQGTGLVGMMGSVLHDGESQPESAPGVKNMSLSGYIYGRRMVGGFVGCLGGGANAAAGSSVNIGAVFENLANHADIYCTDSKGLGGIVATAMVDTGWIVNCYNTGYLCADYPAPTGGIVGSNEGLNIYCCYNLGAINTNGNVRGRGIGADGSGSNYRVSDCYFLEECGDDPQYPGYYTANLARSVKVSVESMTRTQMSDGTLLEKLNVNGTAYAAGDDGFPVLIWEKEEGNADISLTQSEGGTISSSVQGNVKKGTVVYLFDSADTGYNFRYFEYGGRMLTGKYLTADISAGVSGYFEDAKPGALKIIPDDAVTVTVTKNGTIMEGGSPKQVTDYPVNAGDPLYEGDLLIVDAKVKEGKVPSDPDLVYGAQAGLAQPFEYVYTYMVDDEPAYEPVSTSLITYTVGSEISESDISLTLKVVPLTTYKQWRYIGDTSWYKEEENAFTINTARELAGLAQLVYDGNDMAGKAFTLGKDISLANDDGSEGLRYWDGIGTVNTPFAGTFDGAGHKITDIKGGSRALFGYVYGTEDSRAAIKDITVYGTFTGADAGGIASYTKYTDISGCTVYAAISSEGLNTGGIVSYANTDTYIKDCINYSTIIAVGYIGGICGQTSTTTVVEDCVNCGNILCLDTGGNNIGGIAGSLTGTLKACANYGHITASGRNIGGICGQSVSKKSLIEDCYNAGTVTYKGGTNSLDTLGGICGFGSYFVIRNSFNYGAVRKVSGTLANYEGALIGREGAKSDSLSEDVYFLDSSNKYAENATEVSKLPDGTYANGMKSASAADFASESGVIKAVNEDGAFAMGSAGYPELKSVIGRLHVHSGGSATCSKWAVCDTCGLGYGEFDDTIHLDTRVSGGYVPAWNIDGYTGDVICSDCNTVLEKGNVVKADTARRAIRVVVHGQGFDTTEYSVAEFDAMKEKTPVGYIFGVGSKEIMAATEYVTLDSILKKHGLTIDDVESITVKCKDSADTIKNQDIRDCVYYYEDGRISESPFAFAIRYSSESGTLEQVSKLCVTSGELRFGYGASMEQIENKASIGGRRLVSPVRTLLITLYGHDDAKYEFIDDDADVTDDHTHNLVKTEAKEATESADGNIEYWTCTMCGRYFTDAEGKNEVSRDKVIIPMISAKKVSAVTLDKSEASVITEASVKLNAEVSPQDAENKQLIWTSSDQSVATVDQDGTVHALRYGKAVITAAAADGGGASASCTISTRFYDVSGSNVRGEADYQYYYDPVYWAAENGITQGYDRVYFGPERNCERRELMIFLWRMAGSPDSSLDPSETFTDMGAYAASSATFKAVAWGVEKGITKGYSDHTFRPTDTINRKDTMIMLYRVAGKPAYTQSRGAVTFTDVAGVYGTSTDTYNAIAWAYNNSITNGYSTGEYAGQFGCMLNCLRRDIVTFLSRYNALK